MTTSLFPGDSPESTWIACIDVLRLLKKITPKQRQAVVLHYLVGMEDTEIANALGVALPAFRTRVFRGVTNMRRLIQ